MKHLVVLVGFAFLFSCSSNKERKNGMPEVVAEIRLTADQIGRRETSEKYCRRNSIPVYENKNTLYVVAERDVKIRSKDEIVDRALALCYLGLKSEGTKKQQLDYFDDKYKVITKLTREEKQFANTNYPTQEQVLKAGWHYESLHVLLWSLGFIDSLSYPSAVCNVADDVKLIFPLTSGELRERGKLRSKKEILDQADLILRIHWACVNNRIKGEEPPASLNGDVVYERHYALNWLINYLGLSWDLVTTDT